LRRVFATGVNANSAMIKDVMHSQPNTIQVNALAIEAIELMETKKINGLLVTNEIGVLVGAFNMHDLLKAKVV